jgi:hypothetical protein
MKRGAMTHGSKSHREHGSTGPGTTPGRNFPGLKMSGHMGNVRRKVRSLQVLKVDMERRAIVVKGSVPGKAGNILEIAPAKVGRRHREGGEGRRDGGRGWVGWSAFSQQLASMPMSSVCHVADCCVDAAVCQAAGCVLLCCLVLHLLQSDSSEEAAWLSSVA